MMPASRPASLLVCLLLLTGCQSNPFAHRFLKREPANAEVTGDYRLNEAYLDSIEDGLSEKVSGRGGCQVTLHPGGRAELTNFPLFESDQDGFDYRFTGFGDLEAKWEIAAVGTVSSGDDSAETVFGILFSYLPEKPFIDHATLTGSEAVDGMIFTFGDPDAGQILGFEKISHQ